jgi:hypothetical protein
VFPDVRQFGVNLFHTAFCWGFQQFPVVKAEGHLTPTFARMSETRFECGYAKLGTSACKKCKQKIEKGSLRIAKVSYLNIYDASSCDLIRIMINFTWS